VKNYFTQSYNYTQLTKNELTEILFNTFGDYYHSICFLATGSFGKYQLTPDSDIDLICILDNTLEPKSLEKMRCTIKSKLIETNYKHVFEFYPIATLNTWKWLAQYSTLYCSDLFFAIPLYGNIKFFRDLMHWIYKHNLEATNCQSHFIYNLLYRNQQLNNSGSENSLKYQKGGLRDFQFIKWIAHRIYKAQTHLPKDYLAPLYQTHLLDNNEYNLLTLYSNVILGYKWELEQKNAIQYEYKNVYDNIRNDVSIIIEKMKTKIYKRLFKNNIRYIETQNKEKAYIFPEITYSNVECVLLPEIWDNNDIIKLEQSLIDYSNFWSIRAALALNSNCPYDILKKLMNFNYVDMDDIRNFILQNPNYSLVEEK
jgi:hypothetical protein